MTLYLILGLYSFFSANSFGLINLIVPFSFMNLSSCNSFCPLYPLTLFLSVNISILLSINEFKLDSLSVDNRLNDLKFVVTNLLLLFSIFFSLSNLVFIFSL